MIKKYLNGFIVVGILMLMVTFLLVLFPSTMTSKNPYTTNILDGYTDDTGAFVFRTAPFAPDEDYLLGTDDSGRDVLSFIVYGTRLTLSVAISVTLFRFLLALIFGIAAGYQRPISKIIIEQFNNVFNAIPPVLLCILVLSIPYFKTFSKTTSTLVFILVLTLVEWARSGAIISERVMQIRQKDFIKSEIAIGKHPIQIIFGNILPHLLPELSVMFFMEIARVLTVLMQLGIFNIFIGNLRIVASTDQGNLVGKATSYEPEWSSMLGSAKNTIRSAPWIVLSSAFSFFFVVLGFNLLGEGIRRQLKKRHILQFSKRESTFGIIAFIGLIAVIVLPLMLTSAPYRQFSLSRAEAVSLDSQIGAPGDAALRQYLISRLVGLGISKAPDLETYDVVYQDLSYYFVDDVSAKVGSIEIEDLALYTYQSFEGKGYVYDARTTDITQLSNTERAKINNKFVLINPDLYADGYWFDYAEDILKSTGAKGIIILTDDIDTYAKTGTYVADGVIIALPSKYEKNIVRERLDISVTSHVTETTLSNVVGFIEGHPDVNEPEAIILGFDMSYENIEEGERRFTFIFNLLSQLKSYEERMTKSVVIIFWDGSQLEDQGGKTAYWSKYYYPIKSSEFYLDLTGLDFAGGYDGVIRIDKHLISDAKPVAANFTNLLVENIEDEDQQLMSFTALNAKEPFYYKWGIPTVYLQFETEDASQDLSANDLGNILIESLVFELY